MPTLFLIVGLLLLVLLVWTFRKKGISPQKKNHIQKLIDHVHQSEGTAVSVLEADTVLHQALKAAGCSGSMGECLKQYGSRLLHEQAVWDAHKLRNRIAHEPQVVVSPKEIQKAVEVLLKAARKVIGN